MAIVFYCPNPSCRHKLKAQDALVGKRVKCTRCPQILRVPESSEDPPPAAREAAVLPAPSRTEEEAAAFMLGAQGQRPPPFWNQPHEELAAVLASTPGSPQRSSAPPFEKVLPPRRGRSRSWLGRYWWLLAGGGLAFVLVLGGVVWLAVRSGGPGGGGLFGPSLPGASGPRVDYIGKPGPGVELADAIVMSNYDYQRPPKDPPRTFPSGTQKLDFVARFGFPPPNGTKIGFEVFSNAGRVKMRGGFNLTIEGAAGFQIIFPSTPEEGVYPDGPYQAKLLINDQPVAHLNWTIGS
jgi:hypothetical protein